MRPVQCQRWHTHTLDDCSQGSRVVRLYLYTVHVAWRAGETRAHRSRSSCFYTPPYIRVRTHFVSCATCVCLLSVVRSDHAISFSLPSSRLLFLFSLKVHWKKKNEFQLYALCSWGVETAMDGGAQRLKRDTTWWLAHFVLSGVRRVITVLTKLRRSS